MSKDIEARIWPKWRMKNDHRLLKEEKKKIVTRINISEINLESP
jgi:hypothetical protein